MVSLNLVTVVMFASLGLLCGAVFISLRRQTSLGWLGVALLLGCIEAVVIGLRPASGLLLFATVVLVPAAYLSVGQSVRLITGQPQQHWWLIGVVAALGALSLLLYASGQAYAVNGAPFQLACALALADSIYRLAKAGRGWWNLLLMAVLACIALIFLVRIPLYPLVFGPDATFATISASALEKGLMTTSALLTPPAVFLLLGRIVGDVIATYRSRAERDGLTGLYNRRALDEMAAIPDPSGGAVIFCDIDHFKRVNDRFGHQAGDAVIVALATLIEHTGYRAARIGGEEFVVLMPKKSAAEAGEIAEMLRQRFIDTAHPGIPGDKRPTASFGIAEYAPGEAPVTAFVHADGALYGAKQAGRNLVVALRRDPTITETAAVAA